MNIKFYNFLKTKKSTILLIDFCICSSNRNVIGADGGTRTHMVSRWILSPVRLPVPPHQRIHISQINLSIIIITEKTKIINTKYKINNKKKSKIEKHLLKTINVYIIRKKKKCQKR